MGVVRKIEERVLRHLDPKVGPANAVGVHIYKGEHSGSHRPGNLRMLSEYLVGGGKTIIPRADPSRIRIKFITAKLWVEPAIDQHFVRVRRAKIKRDVLEVIAEQRILRIYDVG